MTLFVAVLTFAASFTSATAQRSVSPVGCFQDLHEVQGDIFGFGVLKIRKNGNGYAGTFSERRTEMGEHYDDTRLRNIRYDQNKHTLRFGITFNYPIQTKRNTFAIVYRAGIRLNVGKKMREQYSGPNPFFVRKKFLDCI